MSVARTPASYSRRMPPTRPARTPAQLLVAASLVAVEGLLLAGYGVLETAAISSGRVTMGVTTALFFLAYGGGLIACAWGLWRRHSWGRGPAILAQLIQLGVAWSFRGGETTLVATGLAVVSVVVVVGLLHPASTEALVAESDH
jgi:hypothetical protein